MVVKVYMRVYKCVHECEYKCATRVGGRQALVGRPRSRRSVHAGMNVGISVYPPWWAAGARQETLKPSLGTRGYEWGCNVYGCLNTVVSGRDCVPRCRVSCKIHEWYYFCDIEPINIRLYILISWAQGTETTFLHATQSLWFFFFVKFLSFPDI